MLSKKLTFSLTSLVMLLAFGLVFAPSVMADGKAEGTTHIDFDVTIRAAESMIDVSAVDHADIDDIQIASGRNRGSRSITAQEALTITLLVEFTQVVELHRPKRIADDNVDPSVQVDNSGPAFGADDVFLRAFDKDGRPLGDLSLDKVATDDESIIAFRDATKPGQQYLIRIDENELINAYRTELRTPTNAGLEIYSLICLIQRQMVRKADLAHASAHINTHAESGKDNSHSHWNKASKVFRVDLVDDDEGDPQYWRLTGPSTAVDVTTSGDPATGVGIPGVVSIMRTASRAGFIERGPFDVRIILTEEPAGGFTADLIDVDGGSVTSVVDGAKYKGGHQTYTIPAANVDLNGDGDFEDTVDGVDETGAIPAVSVPERASELGPAMVEYYQPVADTTAGGTPTFGKISGLTLTGNNAGVIPIPANDTRDAVPSTPSTGNGTVDYFPEATGRDNMYYSYIATIAPDSGRTDPVTVSIKTFNDQVYPVPNRYVPLTREQRLATTFTDKAKHARDARVMNESLTVRVSIAGDANVAAAKTAYDARKKNLFDPNPTLKVLDKGLVIPKNGYLVFVKGKSDASGIVNVSAKLKEKLTAAQKLYNIKYEFSLPHPAGNLETFFRNGGTLRLVHADISAATSSAHGDSKASKDTGYVGATTKEYAVGNVVISEIMWGSPWAGAGSQYIELHNTTDADIGIDHLEWAIAVGSAPSDFTVIDSVGNNPSTGYWEVPGSDFDSTVDAAGERKTTPAVSMSRVSDATSATGLATDGTAAASWQPSIRRDAVRNTGNANIDHLYMIGTPGAANAYLEPPAAPTPAPPTPPAKVPAATASDLRISEIMVASNEGRLPQWIEIANVSAAAVSLTGWSISIDNNPGDTDVIAPSVNLKLGDVVIGADQVALVVSKTGRNSGMDTAGVARTKGDANAGNFDADRIIDVQKDVSTVAQYVLISEMAFRISLIPPLPSGVVSRGDVVGNLGQGWELPMSEGNRSSLIRRELDDAGTEITGTDEAGWVSASDTSFVGAYVETYYGDKDDEGTPGYNAGGALPVELSKFSAARDRVSGQVIITWETQSELNNAGFFIKRSQQKDSKFVAVNPTMIPGAGTVSEKQTYTYTDTTAKPNIVYYYQIEDVSLDGNRQTLTRAHRLKGHVGAAGKATTTWGELKTSLEQ